MLSQGSSSNLSEAILNVKRMEKNFMKREFTCIDRDRHKIRASVDRHMESFLQLTRRRHETWFRHDRHFREALRKEKDIHEKRKDRNRHKLLLAANNGYIPRPQTPFEPLVSDDVTLPPISPQVATNVAPTTDTNTPPAVKSKKSEPMNKPQRRTQQILHASQKLLEESAARERYRYTFERPTSTTQIRKRPPTPITASSTSFNSATLVVPMTTTINHDEYNRLRNESLKHETFSSFVDHFVKFRPEFRENFGLINEADKRQKAVDKLREFNQIHTKAKDQRYHNLICSLTDLPSEQKKRELFNFSG